MRSFLGRTRLLFLPFVGLSLLVAGCSKSTPPPAPAASPSAAAVGQPAVLHGYYDGHTDDYVSTDVSSKSVAAAMHLNYAPGLAALPLKALPEIYMVQGPAAADQVTIFGSEPGENNYSPIWRETLVKWKPGATPVLITSDTQIDTLESQGKLTERGTNIALNCPIIKVGKGSS